MRDVPSVVAVNEVMVCVVPFRSTKAVSPVASSGLSSRPPLPRKLKVAPEATAVVPTATVDVNVVGESMLWILLPAATFVPVKGWPTTSAAVLATV